MPKITEYGAPDAMDQQTINYANPNDTSGQLMSRAGQELTKFGDANYQRQAQSEVSELNASFAQARSDWSTHLDEGIRDGTINTANAKEKYKEYIDKMSEGLQTREGRQFFDRQSSRLGGQIIQSAAHGQALVAGDKAAANYMTAKNLNDNLLTKNPEQFKDILDSSIEAVNAQVDSGVIKENIGERLKKETAKDYAKNAIRGWAKLNPDKADEMMNSGIYDQYIDGDVKEAMSGYIHQQRYAKEIEDRRGDTARKKADELASEAWQQKALPDLANGTLKTQNILDSDMSANDKIRWLKLNESAAFDSAHTDPRVKNMVASQILMSEDDPEKTIHSISDMAPYVGHGLSVVDIKQLSGLIDKTPEGQFMKDNRKRLLDSAKQVILQKDPMNGFNVSDDTTEYNLSKFQSALQQKEAEFIKEKKNPSDLYNPNSKDYFGNNIMAYKKTPQQVIDDKAKLAMRRQVIVNPDQKNAPDMVQVIAPDGKLYNLPAANLDKAIAKGYKKK